MQWRAPRARMALPCLPAPLVGCLLTLLWLASNVGACARGACFKRRPVWAVRAQHMRFFPPPCCSAPGPHCVFCSSAPTALPHAVRVYTIVAISMVLPTKHGQESTAAWLWCELGQTERSPSTSLPRAWAPQSAGTSLFAASSVAMHSSACALTPAWFPLKIRSRCPRLGAGKRSEGWTGPTLLADPLRHRRR